MQGFLSAGVASVAGPLEVRGNFGFNLLEHSVLGGIGSILGGGKFANGAVTGAFAYIAGNAAEAAARGNALATTPSLEGPEMSAEDRKAAIDNAISIYRSKPGHANVLFSNQYDTYVVQNPVTGAMKEFSSLADANDFIKTELMTRGDTWQHVLGNAHTPGIFPSPYVSLYAGAAYANTNVYGQSINSNFATLFVIWHESGHVPGYQGGGNCGFQDESCANKYAFGHYMK